MINPQDSEGGGPRFLWKWRWRWGRTMAESLFKKFKTQYSPSLPEDKWLFNPSGAT